jgi:hypothetical protein
MDVWRQKTAVVSKLRVKGKRLDAVSTRLRFESLFGADNFLPEGLPPKAIVCIRNLRDPSPRTLRLNRPDLGRSDAWRKSVAREIEKLYGRAFRPIRETVPAQAESVVFTDNSEMLACLASDWCNELLIENWWWRSLFPNLYTAQTVARIWLETAEFAPSALQILARQGKAVKFVTKLQPTEISSLLQQIIAVFGLDGLQKTFSESFDEREALAATATKKPSEKKNFPTEDFFFVPPKSPAPWSEFVPETRHLPLDFERQSLLGIGLLLARAPRLARSSEFARQVKIFRAEFEISQKETARGKNKILKKTEKRQNRIVSSLLSQEKPKLPTVLTESELETKKSPAKKASKIFADSPDAVEKSVESFDSSGNLESEIVFPIEKSKKKSKKIVFEDFASEKKNEGREGEKETKSYQPEKRLIFPKTEAENIGEAEIEFVEEAETGVEFIVQTRFGGVFYLLNLGLYLNLYRDFTESEAAEIDLNIWDFVALLAFEFLGKEIKNDAVWKLLETLAGRENEAELGNGFAAPDEWRIPPEWLKTFQTGEKWLWTRAGKRLVVRHPAGFSILNVPLSDNAKAQLENELKIYDKDFSAVERRNLKDFPVKISRSADWLKNLTEYVRQRLLQALSVQTQKEINEILFARRADVAVTATHLDITFSLADLPFEVRLSGLDRNPSWIPAVGKFVNFHFI